MQLDVLSPLSRHIWDLKYRLRDASGTPVDRTLADTWQRVAKAAAEAEKPGERKRWAQRFEQAMSDFAFLPAGRILAGAGSDRHVTLFNCFVMGRIEDDMASIFQNVKEAALTMQQGGGIGHDFSTLRPRGAPVRGVGAEASGPVSFMDVWDAMCRTIMSAGTRRGAMMGTMRCDHPDIEELIEAKQDARRLRNFNLSVLVTDAFVAAVREDADWPLVFAGKTYRSVRARDLWRRIMRATYDYAEPGVIFIDRINARNNLAYCETISATNPCVTAETWVQTSEGPRRVSELIGKPFQARIEGGDHATSERGFFWTAKKAVVRLATVEGHSLRLTADHRVRVVSRRTRDRIDWEWKAAGGLSAGDEVMLADHRSVEHWPGAYSFEDGFLLGLLVGDGTLKSDKAVISVWQAEESVGASASQSGATGVMEAALAAATMLPHRRDFRGWQKVVDRDEHRLTLAAVRKLAVEVGMQPGAKRITPAMEAASSAFCRGFLRGFFDADGSVQGSQAKGVSVRLAQSDLQRLQAVQRMLLRLGIASTIYKDRRPARASLLPDAFGGQKLYSTLAQHELVVSGVSLERFAEIIGFSDTAKRARLEQRLSDYRRSPNAEKFTARVLEVVPDGNEDVFDVEVPGINAFDANGLVAHNCGEQPLPPYGACLLGSINLARLVRHPFEAAASLDEVRLEQLVAIAVRFLDNVIDVSGYPLRAQRKEAMAKRRIGLGITGLADALILCGKHYGEPAASGLAGRWMASIQRAAYLASAQLAAERGPFELCDSKALLARPGIAELDPGVHEAIERQGLRNGLLTSIAPTGTISLLADNVSSGIEPVFGLSYHRRILEPDGKAREITVEDYAHKLFRQLHGESRPLPSVFVTAGELSPRQHLAMQAALQPHVDSSISKTINCPEGISFEAFESVYMEAYELGLKGCTTFRPNRITGSVLSEGEATTAAPAAAARPTNLPAPAATSAIAERHALQRPIERDPVLPGFTYKLRWADSPHAIYVTLNDTLEEGRRRPFEIFINSKNLEHYAWTVALTRMISAVFRRGGDVTFVVEELKAVFDPRGGQWQGERYVPSLLAAIGEIIERHMVAIGFLEAKGGDVTIESGALGAREQAAYATATAPTISGAPAPVAPGSANATGPLPGARFCPRCQQPAFILQEGCWVCQSCGYSKCS